MKNFLISFKFWLENKKYNPITIRNYLSDINKYFRFSSNSQSLFKEKTISAYIAQISSENNYQRQLASLNKFCQFALDQKLMPFNPLKSNQGALNLEFILQQYQNFLSGKKFSLLTIKNYINDLHQYIDWVEIQDPISKIENYFNQIQLQNYLDCLKNTNLSPVSIKRKLSSLSTFQKFLLKKKLISAPSISEIKSENKIDPSNFKRPNFLEKIGNYAYSKSFNFYITFAVLIIILAGLSYGLYTQTILKAKKNLAYSTASSPKPPVRQLSFQGKLTDSSGNPITTSTQIEFKFYDTGTTGSGTLLYDSFTDYGGGIGSTVVTPDDNGIFSVIIGQTHGSQIPASVFSENTGVWLEITAGGETMSPRQQIATVAYALNAETLQGLPPSASGLKNSVPVIDADGNINLGDTTPAIIATSDSLSLEGQGLLLKASDGSGGNIEINPDASGAIKLTTEGTSPSGVGGFITATNANLSSGDLFYGEINNENRGYNFLEFKNFNIGTTSLSTRFSIGASGNVYASDNLQIGGTFIGDGSGLTQVNASFLQGATWGAPLAIGVTTANSGYFTDLHASSSLNVGSSLTADSAGNLSIQKLIDITNSSYFLVPANSDPNKNSLSLYKTGSIKFNVNDTNSSYLVNGIASQIQNLENGLLLGVSPSGTAGNAISGWDNNLFIGSTGFVGIGTTNPVQKLEVVGTIKTTGFQMPTGASTNYTLTTDANGNASWEPTPNSVPIGTIVAFSGSTAPDGWLLCAGQAISRTTFVDLFNVIGTTFGAGNTTTTFNIPDLRGRIPVGEDDMGGTAANRITKDIGGTASTWAQNIGATGGEEAHQLTVEELAAHHHAFSGVTNPSGAGEGSRQSVPTTRQTQDTGNDLAHNTIQPSLITTYIIKYGNAAGTVSIGSGLPTGAFGNTMYFDGTQWVSTNNLYNNGTNIGVGTTNPSAQITTSSSAVGGTSAGFASKRYGGVDGGAFVGIQARGTEAAPSASQTGDFLAIFGGQGYGATDYSSLSRAALEFHAAENWTDTAQGSYLTLETTAIGSTLRTEQIRLNNTGLGIGTTNPLYKLDLNGNLRVGSTAYFTNFVGIGTSTPTSQVTTSSSVAGGTTAGFASKRYGGVDGGAFMGVQARGTEAAPSATQANDFLVFLGGRGYGATGYSNFSRAAIQMHAAENWTDTAQGTYIALETTAIGSASRTEQMRLNNTGLGIGTTNPLYKLHVSGSVLVNGGGSLGVGATNTSYAFNVSTNANIGTTLNTTNLNTTNIVGIGTTIPNAQLHVEGGVGIDGFVSATNHADKTNLGKYIPENNFSYGINMTQVAGSIGGTSTADGYFDLNNTSAAWTGGWVSDISYTRSADRTLEWVVDTSNEGLSTAQADHLMIGWGDGSLATSNYAHLPYAWYFNKAIDGVYTLDIYEDGTLRGSIATLTWGDIVRTKIVLKATGADYYYKVNNGNWVLGYVSAYSTETPLYPSIAPRGGRFNIYETHIYDEERTIALDDGSVGIGYINPGTAKLAVNGNVGLGTTNPNFLLDVGGTANSLQLNIGGTNVITTTKLFLAGNGTTATPAYSAIGDTNTGLYFPSADNLGIATSGIERIRVDENGYVGIGTATPGTQLQVGDPNASQILGNTPIVRVIGSGTTQTPETLLRLNRKGVTSVYYPAVVDFNLSSYTAGGAGNGYGPDTQLDIALKSAASWTETATTNVMTLRDNGNVGIGITAPLYDLHVNGVGLFTSLGVGATNTSYAFNVSTTANIGTTLNAGSLTVTGTADIGTTLNVGSLRVGDTTVITSTKLFLAGNGTTATPAYSAIGDPNTGVFFPTLDNLGLITAGVERVRIDGAGDIGIGTTNPLYDLHVVGSGLFTSLGVGATNTSYAFNVSTTANIGTTLNAGSLTVTGTADIGTTLNVGSLRVGDTTVITSTKLFLAGNGTTATPAYSAIGDTNTGLYFPSADNLGIGTSGKERIRVDESGYVGIGTVSPFSLLTIGTGITASNELLTLHTNAGWGTLQNDLQSIKWRDATNVVGALGARYDGTSVDFDFHSMYNGGYLGETSVVMTIKGNGNVGIGTTNPLYDLHVVGSGLFTSLGVGATNTSYAFNVSTTANIGTTLNAGSLTVTGTADIGTTLSAGNLSIGSTNVILSTKRFRADNGVVTNVAYGSSADGNTGIYFPSLDILGIATSGVEAVRINESGYVGIGTTAPLGPLQLDIGSTVGAIYVTAGARVAIGSTNIGIGGTNYHFVVEDIGTTTARFGVRQGSDNLWAFSAVQTFWSDRRLKNNITSQSNILGKIMELNPVTYYWNQEAGIDDQMHYGVIAQEIQKVFPTLVYTNQDGYYSVRRDELQFILAQGIKEQQQQIDDLRSTIDDLTITETGQVSINYNTDESVLSSLGYDGAKNEIENAQYSLKDALGNQVNRIAQFGEIASAKIKAGLLSVGNLIAKNIAVENLTAKKSTIDDLKTNTLSPLANNPTNTININGNASVSGTLTVGAIHESPLSNESDIPALQVNGSASISGTLYADSIISKEGSFGDLMTDKIASLREELKKIITTSLENPQLPDTSLTSGWSADIASDSAKITGDLALTDNLVVGAKLTVNGDTQLGNAFISGLFTAGEIAIKDNLIETANATLYVQPSGNGSVNILNNTFIAENGNVTINGNLNLNGSLTAQTASVSGSLFANLITANDASISGTLTAQKLISEELISEKLNIATESSSLIIAEPNTSEIASTSAQLTTNATAGTVTLPAGKTEIIITNNKISSNSMVYLTPIGSTNNQVVYLKNKTPVSFTISIDNPLETDIQINWWIIN